MTTHQPSSAGNMVGILVGLAILFTSTVYPVTEIYCFCFKDVCQVLIFRSLGLQKRIKVSVTELDINVILLCLAGVPTLLDNKQTITD